MNDHHSTIAFQHLRIVLGLADSIAAKQITTLLYCLGEAVECHAICTSWLAQFSGIYIYIYNYLYPVNQLNSIISNRYINLSARRLLLLSVLRPSLEYGSEVWEGNKSQAASLESIMLGGAKRVLGCSSKTSNEAIWGDMGLEFLQDRRDKHKLSWWYKVVNMFLDIQSNSFKKSGILNHVQVGNVRYGKE